MKLSHNLLAAGALGCGILSLSGQNPSQLLEQDSLHLMDAGQVVIAGKPTPYAIHHLPVSSFPELPVDVAGLLNRRGCTIPQTYEAHRPENVIHASFERAGSSDWAVLCSVKGTVSLLVIFDGGARESSNHNSGPEDGQAVVLASMPEMQRLQVHDPSGVLGFNWGIDPASPTRIHDAQIGLKRPPARLDHDALADSTVDQRTVYRFYSSQAWSVLEMPE
jgi:hypothetical protein